MHCAWETAEKNGTVFPFSWEMDAINKQGCLLISEFDSQQQLLLRGNSKIKTKVYLT